VAVVAGSLICFQKSGIHAAETGESDQMAAVNFDRALTAVLKHEGGYVDHPKDPGGATNLGITIRTLGAWRKRPVTKLDVRQLTPAEASAIYRTQYWAAIRGDDLPAGLDYAMFDYAVNSGAGKAIRDLQGILGVQRDGQIGAITLQAIAKRNTRELVIALMARRLAFLQRLTTWPAFGQGWSRRVRDVRALSLAMSAGQPMVSPDMDAPANAPGKARVSDTRTTATPEGRAAVTAGMGTAGQIITEAADKIAPLGTVSTVFQVLFAVLIVAGVGLMLHALWTRHKSGELA